MAKVTIHPKAVVIAGGSKLEKRKGAVGTPDPYVAELLVCREKGHKLRPYPKAPFDYCLRCRQARKRNE